MTRRQGVSLIEIVIGAMILAVSGVTVLELMRSSTANLQVTEVEVIARGMGADLLERYSRPSVHDFPAEQANTRTALGVPAKWDVVMDDASLKYGFQKEKLQSLLDQFEVTFTIDVQKKAHPTLGRNRKLTHVSVVAKWIDATPSGARNPSGEFKEVTFDCLVDR